MEDDYKPANNDFDAPSSEPFSKRWFGPLHTGGFRSALLTLCSSMIGVGFLTLPVIGKNSGLYPMLFFIVFSSMISLFANWQLGRGYRITGGKTYNKIVTKVAGRASGLITMIFLFLYVYVSAGAYYVFGAKFGMSFIDNWKIRPDFLKDDDKFANYFIVGLFVVCFLGSLPSKITALRYFTFITAIINLVLGALLLIQIGDLRDYYTKRIDKPKASYPMIRLDMNIFGSYCLSLFSSVNQFSVVNVLSEYERPSQRRIDKLILRSPVIPLVVYLLVAVGGFFTCGDQCDEIIINRDHRPGTTDYLMDISKVALLVCLVVGIIIRNQSNKAGIFGIVEQCRRIQSDDIPTPALRKTEEVDLDSPSFAQQDDSIDNIGTRESSDTTVIVIQQIEETPTWVIILVQLINCFIPAATAILVKDNLINYVESGSGFLAPVFMIIYPCIITIKLHQRGAMKVSSCMYAFIWIYMIVCSLGSYAALVISMLVKFKVL